MKSLSVTLCLVLGCAFANSSAKTGPQYPRISEVQGKVKWTDKDGKEAVAKAKQVLTERAALQTEAGAQVVIELDAHRKLWLYPSSRLEIPAISWESGEAPALVLKYGSFRWKEGLQKTYNIALTSDLFEFLSPRGDFVFSYDPKRVVAEVKVIEGSMEFSAMSAEDVALVTAGQKCSFQGVRDGDGVVYDVLLKGKKIPRGKLGLVEAFSPEEKKLYSAAREKKAEQDRKRQEAAKKNLEKNLDPLAICAKPAARLNQCAWVCENNPKKEKKVCRLERPEVRCLRKRCNANGEWAESTEVPKDKASSLCGPDSRVRDCDY